MAGNTRKVELIGQVFGRLTVVECLGVHDRSNKDNNGGRTARKWLCFCQCGGTVEKTTTQLRHDVTKYPKHCGCLTGQICSKAATRPDSAGFASKSHPQNHLYRTWESLRSRCNNPRNKDYKYYGGRGIKHFEGWNSFTAFKDYVLSTLKDRPAGKSLDRIDNDKNYEPGNLRWATPKEQVNNRRCSKP